MSRIIVGVDGSERSADALNFASLLARRARGELLLVSVYPYDDGSAQPDTEQRHRLRAAAQLTLDRFRMRVPFGIPTATRTMADHSPARALHTLAVRERASLIVIGSSHRGTVGRIFIGTTAERLLHGAPCPVAVVPRGARAPALGTIVVGFDGSPESVAAHAAANAVASSPGADVTVVEAIDDPVGELVAASQHADLLLLGSRGHGPHRAVLLGSVSGRVVRAAACPVIVVPRGVAAPLEDLFRPVLLARAASPRS